MIARCSRTSLVRLRRPESCLPSMSTMHRSSGFMKPLQIIVGVQSTSFSPMRIRDIAVVAGGKAVVVNPPADVADLFLQLVNVHEFSCVFPSDVQPISSRPLTAQPCPGGSVGNVNRVQNRGVVGVDRLVVGIKRLGGLAPFADRDATAVGRAQIVVDD